MSSPHPRSLRNAILPLLLLVGVAGCSEPQLQDLQQFVAATKASASGKPLEPLPKVEPYKPFLYEAQGLRNPFAVAEFVKEAEAAELAAIDNGIRPDPNRPREELEKFALGSLVMVGTFKEINQDTLWALIKAPDGIVHRVRPGNYLGGDHGKILSITEQRIDLREIVPDGEGRWKERDAFLSLAE
ncbi:MAG TPA: pilus assembly protein PilP [Candidatus Competibacteraceae bacterium]|nr:pilus assembly protein PilP [Candidatus Competibacteraceae bacterium]